MSDVVYHLVTTIVVNGLYGIMEYCFPSLLHVDTGKDFKMIRTQFRELTVLTTEPNICNTSNQRLRAHPQ